MDILLIYVTHSDQHNADRVSDHLFHLKLIASVHSYPVAHTYLRKGKIEKTNEIMTIYKTKAQNWLQIKDAIKSVHPSDTPHIIKVSATTNHAYGNWLMENII